MRAVLLCAGQGTRWTGEEPKHLSVIDGERLIDRTVRLLAGHGITDTWVIATESRYRVEGSTLHPPEFAAHEIDKVLSSRKLWTGDTCLLCGDVWFSEDAMRTISDTDARPFRFFGRWDGSERTGSKYGEIFALRFHVPETVAYHAFMIRKAMGNGADHWGKMWQLYQSLIGQQPRCRDETFRPDHHWTEIDDWTDDFDRTHELSEWLRRRHGTTTSS